MKLSIIFHLIAHLSLVVAVDVKPVRSVGVLPDDLAKAGYWHKEYDSRCGVDMLEAHGADAAMSLNFYGSGFVARLLGCESCSEVEITIDNLPPIVIDLAERGFKCPTGSPVFVKTDLHDGNHTVLIRRLDDSMTLKVMKFEYLTHNMEDEPEADYDSDDASTVGIIAKAVVKGVASYAVRQAMGMALSYAVVAAANAVVNHVAPGMGNVLPSDSMGNAQGGASDAVPGNLLAVAGATGGPGASGVQLGGVWFDPAASQGGIVDPVGDDAVGDIIVNVINAYVFRF